MEVRGAPKFTRIAGSQANPEDNIVEILFDAVDGQKYLIAMAPDVIPALIVAVTGHAGELGAIHGEPPIQPLPVRGLSISMGSNGAVALVLRSESDLQTVLSFPPDQIPQLRSALAELDEILSRKMQ